MIIYSFDKPTNIIRNFEVYDGYNNKCFLKLHVECVNDEIHGIGQLDYEIRVLDTYDNYLLTGDNKKISDDDEFKLSDDGVRGPRYIILGGCKFLAKGVPFHED